MKRVSLECKRGRYFLVVRIPIRINAPGEFIVSGDKPEEFLHLTNRERAILEGVAKFKQNKEIASDLNLSARTVKFHVSNLLTKYGVAGRSELAFMCLSKQSKDASIQ